MTVVAPDFDAPDPREAERLEDAIVDAVVLVACHVRDAIHSQRHLYIEAVAKARLRAGVPLLRPLRIHLRLFPACGESTLARVSHGGCLADHSGRVVEEQAAASAAARATDCCRHQ